MYRLGPKKFVKNSKIKSRKRTIVTYSNTISVAVCRLFPKNAIGTSMKMNINK